MALNPYSGEEQFLRNAIPGGFDAINGMSQQQQNELLNRLLSRSTISGNGSGLTAINGAPVGNALAEQVQPMNSIRNNSTGRITQLEAIPQNRLDPVDFTSKVELWGGKRGYYGKGDPYTVYDAEGNVIQRTNPGTVEEFQANQDRNLKRQQAMAQIAHTEAQIKEMNTPKRPNAPEGYMWNKEGTGVVPIPGYNGEDKKPLTEFEGKSSVFGARAASSDKIINEVGKGGEVQPSLIKQAAESVPLIGGALGMIANKTVVSPEQQRIEQAQRDFINATLRQESGAVISPQEFDNARKQYFPQPGDSPDVIAQKAANRQEVVAGFKTQAGKGWNRIQNEIGKTSAGPKTGEVQGGYMFLGGNPGDPSRWKKVQ